MTLSKASLPFSEQTHKVKKETDVCKEGETFNQDNSKSYKYYIYMHPCLEHMYDISIL